jgi:hypothetical protein
MSEEEIAKETASANYGASSIQVLEGLEADEKDLPCILATSVKKVCITWCMK